MGAIAYQLQNLQQLLTNRVLAGLPAAGRLQKPAQ